MQQSKKSQAKLDDNNHTNPEKKNVQQNKKSQPKLDRTKKLNFYFCVIFDCYVENFISGNATGQLASCTANFEVFLIFFSFLKFLTINSSGNSQGNLHRSLLYYKPRQNI